MGVNINTIRLLDEALKPFKAVENLRLALMGDLFMRGSGFKFRRANAYFRQFWKEVISFDINGSADEKVDLSDPIHYRFINRFDALINGGTAEHVLNQNMFFANCHEMVKRGGVFVHVMPEIGSFPGHSKVYYDEGFFTALIRKYRYTLLRYERIKHKQGWAIYAALKKDSDK